MDLALHRALEAVRHVCDAAPPWSDILDTARAVVGGDSATFILFEERQLVAAEHTRVAEAAIRDYVQHFHPQDILLRTGPPRPAGTWLDSYLILRGGQAGKSSYYTDFMCPHRMRQMLSFVIEETDVRSAAITVHRSEVDDGAQACLRSEAVVVYGRAVQQAFSARREQALRMMEGAAWALDGLGEAAMLISGRGTVQWASPAAQALLDRSSLRLRQGRWWHSDGDVRNALATALLRVSTGVQGKAPVRVIVPGAGQGCLALEMVRADPRVRLAQEAMVLVRMHPRSPVRDVPVDALCTAFRISPAEARVLAALVTGETLADHAQAHGVSIHTVRKQIANLRDKMGCARQVDMVRQALAVV